MMTLSQRQISFEPILARMPSAKDGSLLAASFNHGKREWTFPRTKVFISLRSNQVKSTTSWEGISRWTDTKLSHLADSTRISSAWPINSRQNSHIVGGP